MRRIGTMKKKNLNAIISVSVIAVGLIATLSTAAALYYKAAAERKINISLTSGSNDARLSISAITEDDSTKKLNPENTTKGYSYTIRGNKDTGSAYTQDVVVGDLKVTFKTKSQDLFEAVTLSNVIDYKNYSSDEAGTDTYFSQTEALNTMNFERATAADTEGYYTISGSMEAPVSVLYEHKVALSLSWRSENITDDEFFAVAEAAYSINVKFEENTTYEYAYIGGVDGMGWDAQDGNRMVPNIYASEWQWMWRADKDYGASSVKAFKPQTSEDGTDTTIWSFGENTECTVAAGDSFYWAGNKDSTINFYHPEA